MSSQDQVRDTGRLPNPDGLVTGWGVLCNLVFCDASYMLIFFLDSQQESCAFAAMAVRESCNCGLLLVAMLVSSLQRCLVSAMGISSRVQF